MNTRAAIQPSTAPAVLSLSFSTSRNRFIAGLSDGVRIFRTDNCLTTRQPRLVRDGGIAIAEVLDDRYIAFVAGGRAPAGSRNVFVFWDCMLEQEVSKFDFYEPILGLKLNSRWMIIVLKERTVVLQYQELRPLPKANEADTKPLKGPNKVHTIHSTAGNPYAVATLRNDLLVLPAQTVGQIQLIPLMGGSKRVLRAHNGALRHIALSPTGDLLATTSKQGTLIRVFNVTTLDLLAEFRRGVDKAITLGVAFSQGGRWLAATSDKGTIHMFDLRPMPPTSVTTDTSATNSSTTAKISSQHRKSHSSPLTHRNHVPGQPSISGLSSPSTAPTAHNQGSIQEYYGLRPPPASASPSTREAAATAFSAFKSSPLAPRFFKDVRSIASLPFHIGDDVLHWQGGVAVAWTTAPGGTRKRVKNPVPALPADPSGRPPKGVVAFAAQAEGTGDDEGAVVYVLGGGAGMEARWEMFELLPKEGGGFVLVKRGFRRYLTRQFVD